MSKRAQITGFMLIGIIVLAVFSFVFVITSTFAKGRIKDKVNQMSNDILSTNTIEYYVGICLENSVKEGIGLLGQQGGMIYSNQALGLPENGLKDYSGVFGHDYFPDGIDYLPYDGRINYGINGLYEQPDPKYGYYSDTSIRQYEDLLSYQDNFKKKILLGTTETFPYVCDLYGPNTVTSTTAPSCDLLSYSKSLTEQDILNRYIENRTKECINFSLIKEKFGYDVKSIGNISSNITYGMDDFSVVVKYPLELQLGHQPPSTRIFEYSTKQEIRLKKILEYALNLIRHDIRDAEFNISEDYEKVRTESGVNLWDNKLKVTKSEEPPCVNCGDNFGKHDDLITIEDELSLLHGQPYMFRFAIKNRHPYLDLIQEVSTGGDWYNMGFDIVTLQGNIVKIEPKAFDPDEDKIDFAYTGWKETQEETWDVSLSDNCNENLWDCVYVDDTIDPREWTSNIDSETGASMVSTNETDIGPHNVTLTVYDEGKLKDWQVISILIWAVPEIKAVVHSIYDDITNNYTASIEDPYILDGRDSVVYMSIGDPTYEWLIKNDETDWKILGQEMVVLPQNADINKIKSQQPFLNEVSGEKYDEYDLSLEIDAGSSFDSGYFEVENVRVYECLAHESTVPSYPYNILTGDNYEEFMGNHTCCNPFEGENGGGEFAEKSKVCYSKEGYTCSPFGREVYPANLAMVSDDNGDLSDADVSPSGVGVTITDVNSDYANDIYYRTYAQYCDGERGNVCGGEVSDIYTTSIDCGDKTSPDDDERCQGPAQNLGACTLKNNNPGCVNYKFGESFEYNFFPENPDYDGYCNNNLKKSAGEGKGKYNTAGVFNCLAKCDGAGACSYATDCFCAYGDDICDDIIDDDLTTTNAKTTSGSSKGLCKNNCDFKTTNQDATACRLWAQVSNYHYDSNALSNNCCGDDVAEHWKTSNNGKSACCSATDACVDKDGNCIANGNSGYSGRYSGLDVCVGTNWRDCKAGEDPSIYCELTTDPCKQTSCSSSNSCVTTPKQDGTPCSGGVCQGGVCITS